MSSAFVSEAAGKEIVEKYGFKPRTMISVEGYDTSLPEDDIKSELINHFNSCGEVFNVIVRKDPDHSPNLDSWFGVAVRGYDTSLTADGVKIALINLFSSCGAITHVCVSTRDKKTNIYFHQKEGEAKALDLCGSEVGGFKIDVGSLATIFTNRPPPSGEICYGYSVPAHMIEFAGEIHDKVAAFEKHRSSI